jgi:thiamine-phosphate pyrophosphorylase
MDLVGARLYYVTDDTSPERLEAALSGGVDVVQLRLKDATDGEILAAARTFRAACDRHGALFVLNDRPDLVDACCADGVHVGQEDVSSSSARAAVGPGRIVGLSTHSREQIEAAAREQVDYVAVGPVFQTPTKPGRLPVGRELVRFAAGAVELPWFAIGGIDTGNAASVVAAGAGRLAVVRAIRDAPDPAQAARLLRAVLPGVRA